MNPHVIAFTFARGGSKGVPHKNLRPLAGKPLIAHAIAHAAGCPSLERHIVSTDDDEIARIALEYGAEVPFMRPDELATDSSPELLSWKHAIETVRASGSVLDVMVSVPTTAPLRESQDIEACVAKLLETGADLAITVSASHHSPYFNMVELDATDRAHVILGKKGYFRRQDAPVVYDIATVAYAARADYILETDSLFAGDVVAAEVPAARTLDIDTELDFAFAEFLLSQRETR